MPNDASNIYWDILDQKRQAILPFFDYFKEDFYLAGGTGLALHLGHRDSIDFDFFSLNPFKTNELFRNVEQVFAGHQLVKTQEEDNTLTIVVDDTVKISFFSYHYQLLLPLIETEYLKIASIEDIGSMKLSAITSRSVLKDYVDLYFILQRINLARLLQLTQQKLPTIDSNLILKSLVYFEDIQQEPIIFKHDHEVSFQTVQKFFNETVKSYLANRAN